MALFKNTHEQREAAFVGHRLQERQHFGRSDIEAWLQQQRVAEEPAMLFPTPWQDYTSRIGGNIAEGRERIVTLVSNASAETLHPYPERVGERTTDLLNRLRDVLTMIDWGKVRMYLGDSCIVLNTSGAPVVFYKHNERLHQTPLLLGEHVTDVLLATWRRKKLTWQDARLALCNLFDLEIQRVKNGAHADFDKAVAVSDSGKEIIHAGEVWIYDGERNCRTFDPAQFRTRKIRLSSGLWRAEYSTGTDVNKSAREHLNFGKLIWGQQMFVTSKVKDVSIFVTHEQFCPSPLPEPIPAPVTV